MDILILEKASLAHICSWRMHGYGVAITYRIDFLIL